MTDDQYRAGIAQLKADWGRLEIDPDKPGILHAANDPFTGLLAGIRAPILAEIINRSISGDAP